MVQNKLPCKNHPGRLSSRKCYQCKRFICPDCRKKYFHHLFCSYLCLGKYLWIEKFWHVRRYREYSLLLLIAILLQLFILLIFYPAAEDRTAWSGQDTASSTVEDRQETLTATDLTIDTAYSTLSQTLTIKGNSPANTLLGLWQNGLFRAATVANGGNYEFPQQVLSLGLNNFLVWALSERGITSLVDSFSINYASQRIEYLAVPFSKVNTGKKILALTFDGGSMATGADSILYILQRKKVRSTFFLTGAFIENFPDIVKRLAENGHELANHTYSHPHLTSFALNGKHETKKSMSREVLIQQLNKTDSLLYVLLNLHFKPYWRAPFGEYNRDILAWAAEAGYKHVGWSHGADTRDWLNDEDSPLYRSAEEIYHHLLDMESRDKLLGAVILMHLHSDREDQKPYEILPALIDELQLRGYQLLTISELIHASAPI